MEVCRASVTDSLTAIRRKLSARTNAQAALLGYLAGAIGLHEDCGTRTAYLRHGDADEDPCPACKAANFRWLKQQSEPRREVQPLTDVQVRILKAFHCGRSHRDLQSLWGVSRSTLHRQVADMYVRLCVDTEPREIRRERALQEAQRLGLLSLQTPPRKPLPPLPPRPGQLTELELKTLRAVDGWTLTEAAVRLGIPRTSVSSRLHNIYRKLGIMHLPRGEKRAAALAVVRQP
jgi:DNA-binding NarL/FixJ family response regulator